MATKKILTHDFLLCFFAQFTLSTAFFILIPTLPVYLSRLGARGVEIGVLVGIFSVSSLILRPFVGRALLKIPEAKLALLGSILFGLSSASYLFTPPFWPLLIVRIIQGIGWSLFATSTFTLVTRISPSAHLGESLSYFYLAFNIAFASAPAFGMFLITHFSFPLLFLVCTGLSLFSILITLKLGKTQPIPLEESLIQDQSLLSRKALPPALMTFLGSIAWGAITTFFPLYALGKGVSNPGLFFSALAITLIVARSLGGKILDVYPREKVIFPCVAAHIIAMTILAFSSTLPMFILVAVILGLGNAFFYPSLVAWAIDLAGPSRGPAMATYLAFSDFGSSMGAVIMGAILQLSNYQMMFFSLIFTGIINLTYFHFTVKKRGGIRDANL